MSPTGIMASANVTAISGCEWELPIRGRTKSPAHFSDVKIKGTAQNGRHPQERSPRGCWRNTDVHNVCVTFTNNRFSLHK